MKLEDYPFDPNAQIHELRGIEKLRAVEDPALREVLFRTWSRLEEKYQPREFTFKPKAAEPVNEADQSEEWFP